MPNKALSYPNSLSPGRADVIFFAAAAVFLFTQLFHLPFTPFYLDGDHLIPISNALRLLDGEVMYRDFFHITPPGTELWYAALFNVFGVRIWVSNLTVFLLNFAIVWLAWYLSRQFFDGLLSYLAPSILLIAGFRIFYIEGTYRIFSVVFGLAAIAVLMNGRKPRNLAAAGALCGMASFFMQPRGVMAVGGILLFLVWEHFRRESGTQSLPRTLLSLGLPFLLTIAVTHSYFAITAGFDNYYFALVTFLQKHYPSDPLSNSAAFLSDLPDIQKYLSLYSPVSAVFLYLRIAAPTLFFYALIPFVYFAFFVFRWRTRSYLENDESDRKLMLLCIVGVALSAGVSAPSVFRLAHVAVPGLVVFVWLISRIRYSARIAAIALSLLAAIGIAYVIQRQTVHKYVLDMPAGRAAFVSGLLFERYKWVGENTRPGDSFYEGHHSTFYFPFHLKNPTPMYVLRDSDYSPQFQVDAVVRSLEVNPPKFIAWPRKWTKPAIERLPGDHLEILSRFVHERYRMRFVFEKPLDYTAYSEGDIEIWERIDH